MKEMNLKQKGHKLPLGCLKNRSQEKIGQLPEKRNSYDCETSVHRPNKCHSEGTQESRGKGKISQLDSVT